MARKRKKSRRNKNPTGKTIALLVGGTVAASLVGYGVYRIVTDPERRRQKRREKLLGKLRRE